MLETMETFVTVKLSSKARHLLRIISAITEEKQYAVMERLLDVEASLLLSQKREGGK